MPLTKAQTAEPAAERSGFPKIQSTQTVDVLKVQGHPQPGQAGRRAAVIPIPLPRGNED